MDINTELLTNRSSTASESAIISLPFCSATIHQHQCLFIMHSSRSQGFSFPTTLVNHPPCRNFYAAVGQLMVRYAGIFLLQGFQFFFRHNGVHKETAGITHHFRIGQLALANSNNHFPDNRKCQRRIFSSS